MENPVNTNPRDKGAANPGVKAPADHLNDSIVGIVRLLARQSAAELTREPDAGSRIGPSLIIGAEAVMAVYELLRLIFGP
jgi:hypothetical protein